MQVKDFAFVIAEFRDLPVSPFLQVHWDGSHAFEYTEWWLNLMSLQTDPKTDCYGVPLVTNLQVKLLPQLLPITL